MDIETGTIISVNVAKGVCDILLPRGAFLYDVPILGTAGSAHSGGYSWLSDYRGAVVAILSINGTPYILATVPVPSVPKVPTSPEVTSTQTGEGNTLTYGRESGTHDYSGGRGNAFLPGDKYLAADGGAELLLGREGFVVLKASSLAQIIMSALRDNLRIVAREFELFTDFGVVRCSHAGDGRTGLTIEGGAEYGTEAAPDGGVSTVHLHMGDTPDAPEARFGVRVNSVDGTEFVGLVFRKDGVLVLGTSKDAIFSVGKDCSVTIEGDSILQVAGSEIVEVGGEERSVIGKRELMTTADETHSVGGDMNLQVAGTLNIGAGGISISSSKGGGAPCTLTCSSLNIVKG